MTLNIKPINSTKYYLWFKNLHKRMQLMRQSIESDNNDKFSDHKIYSNGRKTSFKRELRHLRKFLQSDANSRNGKKVLSKKLFYQFVFIISFFTFLMLGFYFINLYFFSALESNQSKTLMCLECDSCSLNEGTLTLCRHSVSICAIKMNMLTNMTFKGCVEKLDSREIGCWNNYNVTMCYCDVNACNYYVIANVDSLQVNNFHFSSFETVSFLNQFKRTTPATDTYDILETFA